MGLQECIVKTLTEYETAKKQSFTQHPLANFLRRHFASIVESVCADESRYLTKGSAGQANWAQGPWVAAFDRLVTTSAQRGYYPVYLFREDMQGVYLSLNQGMTEVRQHYKAGAKTALRARATNYRAMLGALPSRFSEISIDLAPSASTNDTAFYEAGNVVATYYPRAHIPEEASLITDLQSILDLYDRLISSDTASGNGGVAEGDEPSELHYEDSSKFRMHRRIERNPALAKEAKRILGCSCQVCGANFGQRYGDIGKDYIEAHHLVPVAALGGKKIALDPAKDFAVLCANCHRMVHRSAHVGDMEKFKATHFKG